MLNILDLAPKHINIDVELAKAPTYAGTFTELVSLVKDKKLVLVIKNDGRVIGMYVESGAGSVMLDELAGKNFEKAYASKPVEAYVEIIVSALHSGKQITDINEDAGTCAIDGEVVIFDPSKAQKASAKAARTPSVDLPTEVVLSVENDLGGNASTSSVASYLRGAYNHYLSGLETPFEVSIDEDEVTVTNIKWGRKR